MNIYSKLCLEVYEMIVVCVSVWDLLYLCNFSSEKDGPSSAPPSTCFFTDLGFGIL